MPAVSQKQATAMRIAESNPSKLHKENRGMLRMAHDKLHDFASTPSKGLPVKVGRLRKAAEREG